MGAWSIRENEPQPADMTNIDVQLDPGSAGHNISQTDQVKKSEPPETQQILNK